MKKTKIDWADSTWNPVTGCLHNCEYCYARGIANRFGGYTSGGSKITFDYTRDSVLDKPLIYAGNDGKIKKAPYPFGFKPTFHRYRLDEPKRWTKPRTIFVGSMCDLFGDWVPNEWIEEVFAACKAAPQHRYLFLTKNSSRYMKLVENCTIPADNDHYWIGSTVTSPDMPYFWQTATEQRAHYVYNYLSIEPILNDFGTLFDLNKMPELGKIPDWIIVGAETGNRKDKVIPQKEWIVNLSVWCKKWYVPLLMKESLCDLMGDDFIQEFPWEV